LFQNISIYNKPGANNKYESACAKTKEYIVRLAQRKEELKMSDFEVMLIKVDQRVQKAVEVQSLLTKYGCNIKMRLGLHEAGDACSNQGLIILQITGDAQELKNFEKELNGVEGVKAKTANI
jgi:hypothetical protein